VTLNTLLDKQGGIQTAGLNQELSALRGQYGDAPGPNTAAASATAPQGTLSRRRPAGVAITHKRGRPSWSPPTVAQSYLAGNPSDLSALISAMAHRGSICRSRTAAGRTHREWRWVAPRLSPCSSSRSRRGRPSSASLTILHPVAAGAAISSDKVHLSEPQLLGVTDPQRRQDAAG